MTQRDAFDDAEGKEAARKERARVRRDKGMIWERRYTGALLARTDTHTDTRRRARDAGVRTTTPAAPAESWAETFDRHFGSVETAPADPPSSSPAEVPTLPDDLRTLSFAEGLEERAARFAAMEVLADELEKDHRPTLLAAFRSDFARLEAEVLRLDDAIERRRRRNDRELERRYFPQFGHAWRRFVRQRRLPGWRDLGPPDDA